MAWLLRDGDVLATLEVAGTRRERRRGLLGRDTIDGALLIRPARSVHTVGMRFAIDVAYCDAELVVQAMRTLQRHRLSMPRRGCCCVIEARAGAFDRWRLRTGDRLEVKD